MSFRNSRNRRRGQRGLTVYVVVLVIAMLSAVGVFATKSASLALAQGGYVRQSTQTHYVTEYALDATLAAVASDIPGHIQQLETFDEDKSGTFADWQDCKNAGVENARCFKFGRAGLQQRLTGATDELFVDPDPATAAGQLGPPGSLGRSILTPQFIVEATDLAQLPAALAGERAGGAPVAYYSVTFTAMADVGAPVDATANSGADYLHRVTMSLESARVQTTLGPVPAR